MPPADDAQLGQMMMRFEAMEAANNQLKASVEQLKARISELETGGQGGSNGGGIGLMNMRPPTLEELDRRIEELKRIRARSISAGMARSVGYTCAEAKAAGYVMGLKEAGYTCAEAKAGNYTCAQVKMAGYTLAEMRAAGFTCAEAKAAGFNPKESMQAGFTYQEGLAVGYPSHIDGHPTNVTSWNFGVYDWNGNDL